MDIRPIQKPHNCIQSRMKCLFPHKIMQCVTSDIEKKNSATPGLEQPGPEREHWASADEMKVFFFLFLIVLDTFQC